MINIYCRYLIISLLFVSSQSISADPIPDPTMPASYKNNTSINSSQESADIPYEWVLQAIVQWPSGVTTFLTGDLTVVRIILLVQSLLRQLIWVLKRT